MALSLKSPCGRVRLKRSRGVREAFARIPRSLTRRSLQHANGASCSSPRVPGRPFVCHDSHMGDPDPTPVKLVPGQTISVREFQSEILWKLGETMHPCFVLKAAVLPYVSTSSPWLTELAFPSNAEAAVFCSLLRGSRLQVKYFQAAGSSQVRYFIINRDFSSRTTRQEMERWVNEVLPAIVAAAMMEFPQFAGISVVGIFVVTSDGRAVALPATRTWKLHGLDGLDAASKVLSSDWSVAPVLGLSYENADFWKALYHYGAACGDDSYQGWSSLYKAFEMVRRILRTQLKKGSRIQQTLGIPGEEIKRFSKTVNSPQILGDRARHADPRDPEPEDPMDFREASDLIGRIIRNLYEKLKSSS